MATVTNFRGHKTVTVDENGARCTSCCQASAPKLLELPPTADYQPQQVQEDGIRPAGWGVTTSRKVVSEHMA